MNRDPAYSRVYGYGLLDDLHNLFPEILYDSRIFPGEEVHSMNNSPLGRTTDWIRFRISSMFPQTFVRAKASYERNLSPRRREDFERWLFTHFIHPPAPRQYFPPTNVIFQEQTRQQDSDSEIDGIISILNLARSTRVPIVNTLASNNLTGGWLADFFSSIPVLPTQQDIDNGSEILNDAGPEVICAICQDHNFASPNTSPTSRPVINEWRKLRDCSHVFHRACIDQWFTVNVQCPVCRADIRAHRAQGPRLSQRSSSTSSLNQSQ